MAASPLPAANHLPQEINASTMVIRSQRSALRHTIDWIMTLFAWLAFLYLLIRGIMAVGSNNLQGVDMPFLSRAMPSVDTLSIYALAMILQGLMLLVWALYNWSRFHGKTRRGAAGAVDDERLSRSLRANPISVIHHAPDGAITAITRAPVPVALQQPVHPGIRPA